MSLPARPAAVVVPPETVRRPRDMLQALSASKSPFAERMTSSLQPGSSLYPVAEVDATQQQSEDASVSWDARISSPRPGRRVLGKQRSRFFRDRFDEEKGTSTVESPGSEGRGQAMLCADVKTNVKVNDEFTFVTELSHQLAISYNQPVGSVIVALQHGMCMLFGGSIDPAYVLVVKALPWQVQATTNKRNILLLQRHMEKAIGVPAMRGFVHFVPVADECAGWEGRPAAAHLEALERQLSIPPGSNGVQTEDDEKLGSQQARVSPPTSLGMKTSRRGQDSMSLSQVSREIPTKPPSVQGAAATEGGMESSVQTTKRVRKKKSIMQMLFQKPTSSGNVAVEDAGRRD